MLRKPVFTSFGARWLVTAAFSIAPFAGAFSDERTSKASNVEGNGDFVIGPEYKIDPDLTDRGNPKGKSFEFSLRLADSKIFPGDDATLDSKKPVRQQRKVFVYVPAAYEDGTKAPILVTLDGPSRLDLVRHALDNLTISSDPNRRLPAFIVIAVENGGDDGKGSERGLEYDTMSDRFARFINDEVLPAVLNDAKIKAAYPRIAFTDDPWGKAVMGCSSGGAAALTMGWFRPDLFRRLITYSGTFVDQQDDDAPEEEKYPLGAWEYHSGMKLIENSDKKPLRIFTHVAEDDLRANDPEETYHNWVMANRRTAAALKAKDYDYRFLFSRNSKHCDSNVYEQTLAETLVWMWRDYPAFDQEQASLVAPSEKTQKLAGGMKFTEGPAWIPAKKTLVFSDIPNSKLMQWREVEGLSEFRKSEQSNGNILDLDGRLISCQHAGRNLVLTDDDGKITVLADKFDGKRFNSPNDVAVRSDGTLWFTDPSWGLTGEREIPGNWVFKLDPESRSVEPVIKDLAMPNGIVFSPDESRLYVADTGGHEKLSVAELKKLPASIRCYGVGKDGKLGKQLFQIDQGSDGMRVDVKGNLYTTSGGKVHIYSADGKKLEEIGVPEGPANVCFGGDDLKTLFITARTSLYSIRMRNSGAKPVGAKW